MRIVARTAAAATVVALVGGAPASGESAGHIYALRYAASGNTLTPYDRVSIRPSGPAIRLGRFGHSWSVSADGARLASTASPRRAGEPAALRFVDLRAGKLEATVRLRDERRRVAATAWVRGRVLAVVAGRDSTSVYAVDRKRWAVVGRVDLDGVLLAGERAPSRLVLLLAAPGAIGPSRIAILDATPRARTVVLDRITAGIVSTDDGADHRFEQRRPGTALSPSGRQVYVFGGGQPAAAVDVATLRVRYAPARATSAVRKQTSGSVREAASLPDGRVVVWGWDLGSKKPVGVSLVEPRTWSARLLDRAATWVRVDGGRIFTRSGGGVGLRLLRPSGEAVDLFRTGSPAGVHVVGDRLLVTFHGSGVTAAVVELGTGRVVRRTVPARPVLGAGQAIVG